MHVQTPFNSFLKKSIATELLPHIDNLLADNNGKFVILNCKILQFKAKKETWLQNEEQNDKKRKLFADIVEEDAGQNVDLTSTNKSKKKKKKKEEDTEEDNKVEDEVDELFSKTKERSHSNENKSATLPSSKSKKVKKEKQRKVIKSEEEEEDESLNFILKSLQDTKNS